MRRLSLLALALATVNCSSEVPSPSDAAGPTSDLAVFDLADPGDGGLDAAIDFSAPDDQASPPDLASTPPDLAPTPPDLAPTPPDLTSPPPDLTPTPPDLTSPPPDLSQLKPWGTSCSTDGECTSGHCNPVVSGAANVCVTTCTSQTDCAGLTSAFCEPTAAGGASGYCIPRSPTHCASCSVDSDCGSLAERCIQRAGDGSRACHIDCALAGAAACPGDYSCADVTDGAAMRKLCVPNSGVCLGSLGGFCERTRVPQTCSQTNGAGVCVGQRTCVAAASRYDRCDAMQPQYKQTCASPDPGGCTLQFAASACAAPTGGTAKCSGGACTETCPGNTSVCGGGPTGGGQCVDTQRDQLNCGVCGHSCLGRPCLGGICQ